MSGTHILPCGGPEGRIITVFISELPRTESCQPWVLEPLRIYVDGIYAPIVKDDAFYLRFAIPSGATGGNVELSWRGVSQGHWCYFSTTLPSPLQLGPAPECHTFEHTELEVGAEFKLPFRFTSYGYHNEAVDDIYKATNVDVKIFMGI